MPHRRSLERLASLVKPQDEAELSVEASGRAKCVGTQFSLAVPRSWRGGEVDAFAFVLLQAPKNNYLIESIF